MGRGLKQPENQIRTKKGDFEKPPFFLLFKRVHNLQVQFAIFQTA